MSIASFTDEIAQDPHKPNQVLHHVTITPNPQGERLPLALIALIDISGSMDSNSCNNVAGMEQLVISRLQLVKHSLKTIISTLQPQDKISLIVFDDNAKVHTPLTQMEPSRKKSVLDAVDKMRTGGCTNIWGALSLGVDEAMKIHENANINIMLFTDGEPNRNPPEGIVPALRTKINAIHPNFKISSFAFGYAVDSTLMNEICSIGNGIYGYCPDCTMVGTIFINYLASIMTTIIPLCDLNGKSLTISNDRPRNLLYSCPRGTPQNFTLTLPSGETLQAAVTPTNDLTMTEQNCKKELLDLIYAEMAKQDHSQSPKAVKSLFTRFQALPKTPFIESLLIDMCNDDPNHGQIEKAFDDAMFRQWGYNYLLSFSRFHELEQCGNFKDESLQLYAGEEFQKVVDTANEIFLSIPPPEGQKMEVFYDRYGGCFDGMAQVSLVNHQTKLVKDLVKGDVLATGGIIQCIVKTKSPTGLAKACVVNGVKFTPYHPIFMNGSWIFPADAYTQRIVAVDFWYNLVVSGESEVMLNGVKAITLGHGRTEGVLKHEYFGTQACIDALQKYRGFEAGFVQVDEPKLERDAVNEMITHYF